MPLHSIADFEALTGPEALTTAEKALIAAACAGGRCVLGKAVPASPDDGNTVRANLLRLLILGGTKNCNLYGRGVWVEGAWVKGKLDVAYCTTLGQTVLRHCKFVEKPIMTNVSLSMVSLDGSHLPGIFAQGAKVAGNLFLRNLISNDTVDIAGASVGGQIDCSGSTLTGAEGIALNARGLKTGGNLLLSKVTANGAVLLIGARIGGQLSFEGAALHGRNDALIAQGMRVERGFYLRKIQSISGLVDLTAARVGILADDHTSHPAKAEHLNLNGLTYDLIGNNADTTLTTRRAWLAMGSSVDGSFRPQPYTQFAKTLRQMGHVVEARRVLIERTKRQGQTNRAARYIRPNGDGMVAFHSLWADARNLGHFILDRIALYVIGYGQDAVRSLYWLIGLFFLATILAHFAWQEGSFAPNSDVILTSPAWQARLQTDCFPTALPDCDPNPAETWAGDPASGMDWDSFNRYAYAADLVVPILDLGQTQAWAPSKDRGPWGETLWWMRWILAALGWIVTGLGAAAVTGVMQRNQPD